MKRIASWAYAGFGAASLMLLVVTLVFWVRSYLTVDLVEFAGARLHRTISGGGGIYFESMTLMQGVGTWRPWKLTYKPGDYSAWLRTTRPNAGRWGWRRARYTGQSTLMGWTGGKVRSSTLPQRANVEMVMSQTFTNGRVPVLHEQRIAGPRWWIPYWLIASVLAIVPGAQAPSVLARVRRSARQRRNLCAECGFDLRASPEICPECGRAVPSVRTTATVA